MNRIRIILLVSIITIFSVILIATENNEVNKNSELEIITNNRTDGTVDFQVRTTSYNGAYAPAHCLAIWVCDGNDIFVRTLVIRAWAYIQHLVKWNQMTNGNDENALITGASPTVHTTWNVNWDCRDRFGDMIPDGNYKIYVEFTEDNSTLIPFNGPWTMVEFTKSSEAQTITPASDQFFQDLFLEYNPSETSSFPEEITNSVITNIDNYPNPFNPSTEIRFQLSDGNDQDAEIEIYNLKGQKIKTFPPSSCHPELDEGRGGNNQTYTVTWNGTDNSNNPVSSGVYFINLKSGTRNLAQKKCILLK